MSESSSSTYGATEVSRATAQKSLLPGLAPYLAEFLGTFVLVFTAGCCVLSPGSATWNSTAIGCVLMVMVYATAPVSGGHLNPAVSFCLAAVGAIRWRMAIKYWVMQVAGGISAGFCFCKLFSLSFASVGPVEPFTWGYALLAEVIYTFALCSVASHCVVSKRNNPSDDRNQFFGLAIGFVVIAGGYAVTKVSGACFNPAVSLGLSATGSGLRWGCAWTGAELIGALLAAIAYRILRWEEYILPEDGLEDFQPKLRVRCASEFLGTFMFVLTLGLNVTMASPAVAVSAAAILMCMMYSLGNVSGGHFNPAVTLSVVLSGRDKCSGGDGAFYVTAQLLGGASAGIVYASFHAAGPHSVVTYGLLPGDGYGPAAAGVAELVFTFVLAYAVLSVATAARPQSQATRQNFHFALAIGSCAAAGGLAIGSVSGGELNPAASLGVAVANLKHHGLAMPPPFWNCLKFSLWELAGGLLASIAFRLTHPGEYKKAALPK